MSRKVLAIVLQVLLVTALTLALAGVYFTVVLGEQPSGAFFDQAVRMVLIFVDIGIITWAVLLIVGAIRGRGIGWGIGGSLVAAVVGIVVNLIWIFILSLINGGADIFAIALGVQAGVFFLLATAIIAPLVLRVIVKPSAGR